MLALLANWRLIAVALAGLGLIVGAIYIRAIRAERDTALAQRAEAVRISEQTAQALDDARVHYDAALAAVKAERDQADARARRSANTKQEIDRGPSTTACVDSPAWRALAGGMRRDGRPSDRGADSAP